MPFPWGQEDPLMEACGGKMLFGEVFLHMPCGHVFSRQLYTVSFLKSSFIFFLSWHGRLQVRGDQKALLIISELRVIRVRLSSDCPVRAQVWSPGKFHGARGATPGFSRPPPPLTGCLAFPYLELESQSHQSLWVGLHLISRLLLEHFRNKNPCC